MHSEKLDDISNNLFKLLLSLNKKAFHSNAIMKNLPIPPSHVKVIFYLFHLKSCPVSKIAKDLCISKPNMSPILDKLLAEGYVERCDDPNDRRIILMRLTEKGHDFFKALSDQVKNNLSSKVNLISAEDLIILDDAIQNLSSILNKIE